MTKVEFNAVKEFHDAIKFNTELAYEQISEHIVVTVKIPCRWHDVPMGGESEAGWPKQNVGGWITKPVEWETKEFFNIHSAIAFISYKEITLRK